jgi:hypothetical protein
MNVQLSRLSFPLRFFSHLIPPSMLHDPPRIQPIMLMYSLPVVCPLFGTVTASWVKIAAGVVPELKHNLT